MKFIFSHIFALQDSYLSSFFAFININSINASFGLLSLMFFDKFVFNRANFMFFN